MTDTSTSHRPYRGLLATLSPRLEVQRHPEGFMVTTHLTVPHIETGEPFKLRTEEVVSTDDEIEPAIVRCFQRALAHEVRECLGLDDH